MSTPSPKAETVTSTQNTTPWSEQIPYLKQGFSEAQKLYNQGPQDFYGGQTYASPDAATLAGMNATEARATAGSPLLGQAQGEASKVLSGNYLDPASNPAWGSMVDTVKANVLPGIDSRYIGAGRSGSGLHGRAVGEGLGSAIGSLAYQNYGAERDRMSSTMNAAPALAAADYMDPSMLGQVGAQREGIAQQGINEAVARHDYTQMAPQQALAQYMQMIQGNYGGQSTGTTQQLIPQANPWMQALGITANVAGTAAKAFASDERLKENIEKVGKMDDGTNIYRYNYLWDDRPQLGVMAQEVEKTKPDAVSYMPMFGKKFRFVDYGRL